MTFPCPNSDRITKEKKKRKKERGEKKWMHPILYICIDLSAFTHSPELGMSRAWSINCLKLQWIMPWPLITHWFLMLQYVHESAVKNIAPPPWHVIVIEEVCSTLSFRVHLAKVVIHKDDRLYQLVISKVCFGWHQAELWFDKHYNYYTSVGALSTHQTHTKKEQYAFFIWLWIWNFYYIMFDLCS